MLNFDLATARVSQLDDNNFLGVQIDAFDGEQGIDSSELLHTYGFVSRPRDPDVDQDGKVRHGCATLFCWDGTSTLAWLATDPRAVPFLPPLKKGQTATYAWNGAKGIAYRTIDPDTLTETTYVPYAFDGNGTATKAHLITVGKDGNGAPLIEIVSGEGQSITMLGESIVIANKSGNAYLELNNAGITANGAVKVNGGVDVGTVSFPVALSTLVAAELARISAELLTLKTATATGLDTIPTVGAATAAAFSAATAAVPGFPGPVAATTLKAQ